MGGDLEEDSERNLVCKSFKDRNSANFVKSFESAGEDLLYRQRAFKMCSFSVSTINLFSVCWRSENKSLFRLIIK